jgi:hypothetical protein
MHKEGRDAGAGKKRDQLEFTHIGSPLAVSSGDVFDWEWAAIEQ